MKYKFQKIEITKSDGSKMLMINKVWDLGKFKISKAIDKLLNLKTLLF